MQTDLQKRCSQAFGLGLNDFPLYSFQSHRQVLNGLRSGLEQGQRLQCLTGPPGSGKSAVFSALYDSLTSGFVGLVTQPGLGDVLSRLKGRLQLSADNSESVSGRELLTAVYEAQRHNLPIIQLVDNADKLQQQDFIQLNRLFQRFGGQVILGGTPALLSLFQTDKDTPDPVQPDQVFQLAPLTKTETGEYIQHRLRQVDFDPERFTADAVTAVAGYSGGLPQLINMLCFMALAESCGSEAQSITADEINDVAKQRWASGIYPFHTPPPAPETAIVQKEDSPPLVHEDRIDTTFVRPAPVAPPLPDDNPLDDVDESPVEPPFRVETAEVVSKEPTPKLFAQINPHAQDQVLPTLYGEQRPFSSAVPVNKPRRSKRWLVAGISSTALAGLGIALYVNSSLFGGKYEQLKSVASATLNQLACVDSGEKVLTSQSESMPPESITALPSTTGITPETPPHSFAQQDDAIEVRNTIAVTEHADSRVGAQEVNAIADSESDFAAFEQPTAVPTLTDKPTETDRSMTDERNKSALSPQPQTVRSTAAIMDTADISRVTPDPDTTADTAPDFADVDKPTTSTKTRNTLTPQAQTNTAREQQRLANTAVANSEHKATQSLPDQPTLETTTDPVPTTAQARPMTQTDHASVVQKEISETPQPSPPLSAAQQSHIASLYLKRAEYEVRNGHYRDALISIGYGLESVPGHPALSRMRMRVLKAMNTQPG